MAVEEIEKLGSDGGIRTVIESDGELAAMAGLEEGVPEKLRARVDSAVSGESGETGGHSRTSDEPGSHHTLFCHEDGQGARRGEFLLVRELRVPTVEQIGNETAGED